MKRFLLSLLLFTSSVAASAQFIPHAPAKGGYCLTHAGAWVPIWADQSASALPNGAPAGDLYGLNSNGTWYGLSCDDSGHLTTLPAMTCNASTVPNYAQAVCVFTLTTADLLQFDGTIATSVPVISTPGANRAIIPSPLSLSTANYIYNSTPFSSSTPAIDGAYGTLSAVGFWSVPVDPSQTYNTFTPMGLYNGAQLYSISTSFAGVPFSVYSDEAMNGGQIATFSLSSGGQSDGVNTSQITSGHAGLTYAQGDTPGMACGAAFFVDSVDSITGAVLTYHETGIGTGCTTGVGQATTGGGDGNLELDVLTVGAGYRAGDTLVGNDVVGSPNPNFQVSTVNANGIITALVLQDGGEGYFQAGMPFLGVFLANGGTQPGIGAGATVDYLTVVYGNGHVILTIPYTVEPVQ